MEQCHLAGFLVLMIPFISFFFDVAEELGVLEKTVSRVKIG